MSPPVTRARIVWLLLLRGAEGAKEASEGAEAVRAKREVGTCDSVQGEWVRVVDNGMGTHRSCVRVEFAARVGGARAEARVGRRGARAEAWLERSARVGGVLG